MVGLIVDKETESETLKSGMLKLHIQTAAYLENISYSTWLDLILSNNLSLFTSILLAEGWGGAQDYLERHGYGDARDNNNQEELPLD